MGNNKGTTDRIGARHRSGLSKREKKEKKAVEIATKIAIEIHGPALKELEKH